MLFEINVLDFYEGYFITEISVCPAGYDKFNGFMAQTILNLRLNERQLTGITPFLKLFINN